MTPIRERKYNCYVDAVRIGVLFGVALAIAIRYFMESYRDADSFPQIAIKEGAGGVAICTALAACVIGLCQGLRAGMKNASSVGIY